MSFQSCQNFCWILKNIKTVNSSLISFRFHKISIYHFVGFFFIKMIIFKFKWKIKRSTISQIFPQRFHMAYGWLIEIALSNNFIASTSYHALTLTKRIRSIQISCLLFWRPHEKSTTRKLLKLSYWKRSMYSVAIKESTLDNIKSSITQICRVICST